MTQGQTPESTALRAHYGLDSLYERARNQVARRGEEKFGAHRKAGELALAPELGAPGSVKHAEYVLAHDRAGKFLLDASDILLLTVDASGEGTTTLYVTHQGSELGEETVQTAISMANEAAREGNYIHRTVLDTDAPLPSQLIPLAITQQPLAEVA